MAKALTADERIVSQMRELGFLPSTYVQLNPTERSPDALPELEAEAERRMLAGKKLEPSVGFNGGSSLTPDQRAALAVDALPARQRESRNQAATKYGISSDRVLQMKKCKRCTTGKMVERYSNIDGTFSRCGVCGWSSKPQLAAKTFDSTDRTATISGIAVVTKMKGPCELNAY